MGRSHAIRFTSTMTLGGKAGWAPASRLFIKPREALLKEAVAPLADNLPWGIQARRDDVIGEALGGQEHQFGPDDVSIRRRIFAGSGLELAAFVPSEMDAKWAVAWHPRGTSS
jgi:hypothetical protein